MNETPTVATSADSQHPRAHVVLFASTLAFMVCFAVWMMLGVIGIPIRETLGLNNAEFGLFTSTPVLLGAVMRVPLGIWTDRFGGRIVMTVLLLAAAAPVYLLSLATTGWQFSRSASSSASSGRPSPSARRTARVSSRRRSVASPWASSAKTRDPLARV